MATTNSFLQSAVNATNLTTYTFSSQNLGTADSGRYIVCCITGSSNTPMTISSVTIGGVTATQRVFNGGNVGGITRISAIYIALVPTGTTGDVVVTFSGGMTRCGVALYRLLGIADTTAFDTGGNTATSGTTINDSIDIPAGGICYGMSNLSGDTSPSTSWTNLSEDFDVLVESDNTFSGASDIFPTAQTARSITATLAMTISAGSLSLVSFSPSPFTPSPMLHMMGISGGLM